MTKTREKFGDLIRTLVENPYVQSITLLLSLFDFFRWIYNKLVGGSFGTLLGPITLLGAVLATVLLKVNWDRTRPILRITLVILLAAFFGFQLGWTRVGGLLRDRNCVKYFDLLPDKVKVLANTNPRQLRGENIMLWSMLAPCDQVYEDYWMDERDAIAEVKRKIRERTCEPVSDTEVRSVMFRAAKLGALRVKYEYAGTNTDTARAVPPDSLESVVNPDGVSYEYFVRSYWSGDICSIEWD